MNSHALSARLLVCDSASFDSGKRAIRLGTVVNALEVPLFPYACKSAFFVRILFISRFEPIEYSIELVDSEGETIAAGSPMAARNARGSDQVPGVDTYVDITYVVCVPGILQARLLINGDIADIHPVAIRSGKGSD